MKRIIVMLFLLFILTACADKAAELYDTAKFEELQNNKEHAVQLYREIVEKYPDLAEAKDAAKRLEEIQKTP